MTIRLPSSMRRLTGGQAVVTESAATLGELLARLEARFPGLCARLREPDGRIKRHMNIFVNGREARTLQGADTPLAEDDTIVIAPAMAGGA